MRIQAFIISGLLMCSILPAFALDPSRPLPHYVLDSWNIEQGLPHSTVEAITQTSDGYLWLGTNEGLARFDGNRFQVFNTVNTREMKVNRVRALFEDREKNLWVGLSGGGAVRLRGGKFANFSQNHFQRDIVLSFTQDAAGRVWIGTAGGLLKYDHEKITLAYSMDNGLSNNYVMALFPDPGGDLWIATWGGGINRLHDGRIQAITARDGLCSDIVTEILKTKDGRLWAGTVHGGLCSQQEGKWTSYDLKEWDPSSLIAGLITDRQGSLWIATHSGGVLRFHDGKLNALTAADGLGNNSIAALFEDREGSIWIGTYRGGLNRVRDGPFTTWTSKDGVAADEITALHQARDGTIWIGTEKGASKLQEGRFTTYAAANGLTDTEVSAIWDDNEGTVWFGTLQGLFTYRDGRIQKFAEPSLSDHVYAICGDAHGNLWVGTASGVYQLRDRKLVAHYSEAEGLPANFISRLLVDHQGTLYVGTGAGIAVLKQGATRVQPFDPSVQATAIMSLFEDRDGVLWIGTREKGLVRYQPGNARRYTSADGLPTDTIIELQEDAHGNLWIGSHKGIFRISKQSLSDFSGGKIPALSPVLYGIPDGLKSLICLAGGMKTRTGELWFATHHGVAVVDPARAKNRGGAPDAVIEAMQVNDKEVFERNQPSNSLVVGPGLKNLRIDFTALSLSEPQKLLFRHKLEGMEDNWVESRTRHAAYTNVPPGKLRFLVSAGIGEGAWGPPQTLEFTVRPYFYQAYWFYGVVAAALILLGNFLQGLRTLRLQEREKQLTRIVAERTADLVQAKQELEQTNTNLEQRVREGVAALREAETMAAYGRLVAGVAHEVRHPVFALQAAAFVLENKLKDHDDVKAHLKVVESETQRMTTLMNDLLDFAKPTSLQYSSVEPGELLIEAREHFHSANPGLRLKVDVQANGEGKRIDLDRSRMVQVFVNLLENARKHAKGATVIRLSSFSSEGKVVFEVSDDGCGIPEENLPSLFEPFFSTGNGTGLGLAIVRRIITEHGGTIEVASTTGRGATFHITLPS